jgi:hypothetical protein
MRIITVILGFIMAIGLTLSSALIQWQLEEATLTVVSKERLANFRDNQTTYENFVYTDDETYVVADSFWNWHFRARTVWAEIPEDGGECQVTLSGVRWGFFSMHQNIISAECE